MARRLHRAAGEGDPLPGNDSLVRMIRRWERGLYPLSERYELLYARAFGVLPEGLRPAAGAGHAAAGAGGETGRAGALPGGLAGPVSSDQVPAGMDDVIRALVALARGDALDVDDVERRELLRLIGGLGLAAPLAGGGHADRVRRNLDGALSAPTTGADVQEWERVAAEYSAESGMVPPAVLLPELLADLDEGAGALADCPDALRAPMARVCGYLSALAAANFFNAGHERDARRYWRTALRVIGQADDRRAQAELMADRASFALLERSSSPSAALALADEAISIGDATPNAGTANGHAARVMALALLGDHRGSMQSLRNLTRTFEHMPGAQTTAYSAWGYSEQQLRFVEGFAYAHAGRVPDASRALDAGTSLVPDGQWIALTSFEVNRAISLIRGGDPSEGARCVVRAVGALPAGYRHSATVRRAKRALDAVPAGAADAPALAEARELLSLPPGAEA